MEPKETVNITKEAYDYLLERDRILGALEGAGVDNWSGYDMALEYMEQ